MTAITANKAIWISGEMACRCRSGFRNWENRSIGSVEMNSTTGSST